MPEPEDFTKSREDSKEGQYSTSFRSSRWRAGLVKSRLPFSSDPTDQIEEFTPRAPMASACRDLPTEYRQHLKLVPLDGRTHNSGMLALALLATTLAQPQFEAKPCVGENAADKSVICGTVRVREDRTRPDGRTIDLNVVVLTASSGTPDLPPLVDLDGGPGLASTRSAAFYRVDGMAYRQRRAVILIDQRGTGGSNPLMCPSLSAAETALQPIFPKDEVLACAADLAVRADLSQYGTDAAAADLDDVRAALGYSQIDIVAISYGTTLAFRYMAAYPGRTRAAVLSGVVPASARPPQHHAVVADAALTQSFADCAADPACRAAHPNLDSDLKSAVARLADQRSPVPASVFMEKVRSLLYHPATARSVPMIVHAAAGGDLAPFRKFAGSGGPSDYADGLYLSITCSESIALMDQAKALKASRKTRFGDYRLQRQQEACKDWPKAKIAADFLKPVKSDAQILLISGGRDPVTPAAWARDAARSLPNARNIVIPWSGHSFEGLSAVDSCYDPMLLRFFNSGDAGSLDTACVADMRPPVYPVGADLDKNGPTQRWPG